MSTVCSLAYGFIAGNNKTGSYKTSARLPCCYITFHKRLP